MLPHIFLNDFGNTAVEFINTPNFCIISHIVTYFRLRESCRLSTVVFDDEGTSISVDLATSLSVDIFGELSTTRFVDQFSVGILFGVSVQHK